MFNFNIEEPAAEVSSPFSKASAVIIFWKATGLGLRDSKQIVDQNFPNEITPCELGEMLAEYFHKQSEQYYRR